MNKKFTALFFTIICSFVLNVSAQNLTVSQIMAEPSLTGMRPDSEKLSPDGKKIVYAWNAAGVEPRNLYLWNGGEPRILVDAVTNFEQREERPESKLNYGLQVRDDFVKAREKNLGGVEFSPDSRRILFLQNSDIYTLELADSAAKPRRVTRTPGSENSARWLTNDSILYSTNGNYFVLNLKETSIIQITKEANPAAFISIFGVTPNKDGTEIAYITSDGSRQKALFVPNYLDEFTAAPTTRRGWTDQKVFVNLSDGSREFSSEIKLPRAEGVSYLRSVKWADNRNLLVDRIDKDLKRRQLFYVYNAGTKDEKSVLLTEETDEKWIGGLTRIIEPNPINAGEILFASERSGYNHLYLATIKVETIETKQLTKGDFEVDFAKWRDGREEIVYSSTEKNSSERQFYTVNAHSGVKTEVPTIENSLKSDAQIATADDVSYLVFKGSKWNQPGEIFYQKICPECREQRITHSIPEAFNAIKWAQPKFINIPSRDGKVIKSKIYLPVNFEKTKKYPMVIFVHGAGYLQNTINGWNNYYREFMFNTSLTQKGYVVLDIDYRGSAGYGRAWRTDVYDFLGGKDFEDHLDAIDFAVKNYQVDAKKIGVYGGSYGGFMAEMLAFRSDKITCAAALRPVADWKNYYASSNIYTAERLGFPEKNPEGYKRSSPISYAEGLNKPLLILHGMMDDNVHAQDSIQLIEKLIRLEKTQYFDMMLYPAENHGFTRPTSWTDEYTRILNFFEKHLKN